MWTCFLFFFFFFFLVFWFLGPHSRHMEAPRLGVELELQLLAYTTAIPDRNCVCDIYHSSHQCQIINPLSEARDRACILMDASQIRFPWAPTRTPPVHLFFIKTQWAVSSSFCRHRNGDPEKSRDSPKVTQVGGGREPSSEPWSVWLVSPGPSTCLSV